MSSALETQPLDGAPSRNEGRWSSVHWTGVVLLIFAAQTGLIFLLGQRHAAAPRAPRPAPPLFLTTGRESALAELGRLRNPTLFALPSLHGFSGSARALTPRFEYVAADWTEPLRWLPFPAEKLGDSFQQLLAVAPAPALPVAEKLEPPTAAMETVAALSPLPVQSSFRVEGRLAGRALLTPLELPSWPSADALTASEVRVMVDAGGFVVSVTLLKSCGLAGADQQALELARAVRFEPLRDGGRDRLSQPQTGLTWGTIIFQWHIVPPPEPAVAEEPSAPSP